MFNPNQYVATSIAVRLSELSTAIEYSAIAEYNTHVVALRSGLFMVTTEAAAEREAEFGGVLVAVKGEQCIAQSSSNGSVYGGTGNGSQTFAIAARAGR